MSLDSYRRYDWDSLIGSGMIEDRIRLMAEEKRMELERYYRLWKKYGPGYISSKMLQVFEVDHQLRWEYLVWLESLDLNHMYKDDATLLKFINHKRWNIERNLPPTA